MTAPTQSADTASVPGPDSALPPADGSARVGVADHAGAILVTGTAQVIEGLLTMGLLEHASGPAGLLALLLPEDDHRPPAERDAVMFLAGAVSGTAAAAARWRTGSRWRAEALREVASALRDAGFEAMGYRALRAASAGGLWLPGWEREPEGGQW